MTGEASPRRRLVHRLLRARGARFGLGILGFFVLVALTSGWIEPHDPLEQDFDARLQSPSAEHWFGTDELGRDLASRTIAGTAPALITAGGAAGIAAAIGVPIGLVAGYYGRWRDTVLMRLIDVLLSLPSVVLALVIVTVLGPGQRTALIAIAIVGVPGMARIVRSEVLSLRTREFVTAVEAAGGSNRYAMIRTILPHTWASVIAQIVVIAGTAILLDATLNFFGLGLPPPEPTWGDILRTSKSYLNDAPYYAVLPGIVLAVAVAAMDSLGRALTTALGRTAAATLDAAPTVDVGPQQ